MKKDKEQQEFQVNFSDSDYQIDMRVDPLTTMDTIKSEYRELMETHKKNTEKQKQKDRPVSEGEERAFAKQDETIHHQKDAINETKQRKPAKAQNVE